MGGGREPKPSPTRLLRVASAPVETGHRCFRAAAGFAARGAAMAHLAGTLAHLAALRGNGGLAPTIDHDTFVHTASCES